MEHRDNARSGRSRAGLLASPRMARSAMLVMLSLAAGCVDAVGYLELGHVFTANMTGNTVLLGVSLGKADWDAVLRSSAALLGFIGGVALGTAMGGTGRREHPVWPRAVTVALTVELAIMVALALVWYLDPGADYRLITLSALAMGVQSTAVRRLGIPGVATTYITGTLTSLTEGAIHRLRLALFPTRIDENAPTGEISSARGLLLPADVWLAYGIGAIVTGAIQFRWSEGVLLVPAVVVGLVVAGAALRFRGGS